MTQRKPLAIDIDAIGSDVAKASTVVSNIGQEFIVITRDKALLCMKDHSTALTRNREWLAPLSVLLAVLLTQATATFKRFLGIDAEVWEALFILVTAGSLAWLGIALLRVRRHITPETLVDLLMAQAPPAVEPVGLHVSVSRQAEPNSDRTLNDARRSIAASRIANAKRFEGIWEGEVMWEPNGDEFPLSIALQADESGSLSGEAVFTYPSGKVTERLRGRLRSPRHAELVGVEAHDPSTVFPGGYPLDTFSLRHEGEQLSGTVSDTAQNSADVSLLRPTASE